MRKSEAPSDREGYGRSWEGIFPKKLFKTGHFPRKNHYKEFER